MKKTFKLALVSANKHQQPYPVYPLGISYLSTYLREHLPEAGIQIFDFNLHTLEEFEQWLDAGEFDYIGLALRNVDDTNIYIQNSFIKWYEQIVQSIRKKSAATLIVGGAGYSIFPDLLLHRLQADYGIQGEGEETLRQLLSTLHAGGDPCQIEGLVHWQNGEVCTNPRTHYVSEIALQADDTLLPYYWERSGMLNIQTKRGCPHKCIYCSYPVIEGRTVRTLEPKQVLKNLQQLAQQGITYVFFTDSVFNIHRAYNQELSQLIIDSGLHIEWGAYFSPKNLTYEDLALYQKAGLTHVEFGTESFSDTQLTNYRKGFTFADVERVSNFCSELNIFFAHFLILGGYGETNDTLRETFANSKKIEHSVFFPYVGMRIYPHTELAQIAIREGRIQNEAELANPIYYTSEQADLSHLREMAAETGKKWVFPDDNSDAMIQNFRKKNLKGPLWEYLRYI